MVKKRQSRAIQFLLAPVVLVFVSLLTMHVDAAEIRLYGVNKKGQQREKSLALNRDEPGCHNLFLGEEVFRIAQVGFTYCSIYLEKDCPKGEALIMKWKGRTRKNSARAHPTDRIMPGSMWYFSDNEERKIRSWKCVE